MCAGLTCSRRWATCPRLLDSMKVARRSTATYGALSGTQSLGGQPSPPYGNLSPGRAGTASEPQDIVTKGRNLCHNVSQARQDGC